MPRHHALAALVLLAPAAPAAAQIVEVPPFTGQQSENLESVAPPPGLIEQTVDVFGGDVTFVSLVNDTTIHLWSGSCLNNDCANPRSGIFLIGATTAQAIVFNTPATRFGSYFTNNSLSDDATATFFDADGNQIGQDTIDVPTAGTGWFWNGWESDVPIGSIEIFSNGVLQGFIWLDDLELDAAGACPADLDGDGSVGILDFLDLLAAWGHNPDHPADLDGDGSVGILDFLALLAAWGPCV